MNPIIYAVVKHNGQTRKGTNLPYVVHPIAVYSILEDAGYSKKICTMGVLHDILEDTKTSEKELEDLFGVEVMSVVKTLSKNLSGAFNFETGDFTAMIVKTADTLSNLEDYIANKKQVVSYQTLGTYKENLQISAQRIKNQYMIARIEKALKALTS